MGTDRKGGDRHNRWGQTFSVGTDIVGTDIIGGDRHDRWGQTQLKAELECKIEVGADRLRSRVGGW